MADSPPQARSRPSRRRLAFAGFAAFAVAAAIGYGVWPDPAAAPIATPPAVAESRPENDLIAGAAANPGYLGSKACAACHAAKFDTFKETRHHWAATAPNDRPMPAAFHSGGASFASSDPAVRFAMAHENGRYVQKVSVTTPEIRREATAPIGMVYGHGGKFDEVYFKWADNRLSELPVTWLHPTEEWANAPVTPHAAGDLSRVTTTRCVECHTTWVAHEPGTANGYLRETAILGVGCERCHGPGKEHVDFHAAQPKGSAAHGIVHPGKLNREQRIDLCAQCHSNAAIPADLPFTHRPGRPLEKSYKTLPSRFPEDNHVADQTKSMRESKCFQKSEMTCLTCHDPHKPSEAKVVADACLKCHGPAHCKEQPRLPEAVRGNCVECHMPQRVWMNVHFHTGKDRYLPPIRRFQHRIGVYPEATREVVLAWQKGRPDGAGKAEADKLTEALVAHWLTEGDRRRKDHRFHAEIQALREALFFDPSPVVKGRLQDAIARQSRLDSLLGDGLKRMEEKRYPAAMESFAKMLEIDPGSAKAHARLGTLNGLLGKDALAVEHLRAAAKADPNDPYPWNMLGWMAYIQKRPADAVPEYLKALEVAPANDELLYRLGLAYLASDKWTEARATLERLYRLNPNHAGGCQTLGHVLLQQRETAEAVRYGRRAAMLTESKNADILLSLCDAYTAAGRTSDALKTAELALGVTDDPGLTAQLRERRAKLGEASLSKFAR